MYLQGIEKGLNDEIQYLNQVSTTQAHEGSAYGIEKVRVLYCRIEIYQVECISCSFGHIFLFFLFFIFKGHDCHP